jgi:hypothetical protein
MSSMNILGPIYRLCIDLIDEPEPNPTDVTGFFYYRDHHGSVHKQYYHSAQRRLLKSMSEEEVKHIRRALNKEGYTVESFTVFHSPTNSFTYKKAFQ